MRHALVVVFVASALTLPAGAAPQPPQPGAPAPGLPGQPPPPRAGPARPGEAPATGTAILRGVVVAADTGDPVRRAIVRAMSSDGSGGMTSTDQDGRFEIRDLPAGRYSLTASKGGFVALQYGQRRPGQGGTPLDLRDGETMEKLQIALPPGGVISGQVFDDFGDPVDGITVSALQYRFTGGSRQPVATARAQTDDRGSFRLYGLAPGDYLISATAPSMMFTPGVRDDTSGTAPTYYPGTANPAEAAQVRAEPGQERAGVSFPIVIARMARVSGRVVSSSGSPVPNAMVRLMPATGGFGATLMRGSPTDQKGIFTVANVPSGEYLLQVSPLGPPAGPRTEAASLPVTVGAGDLEDLLITTMPGGTARGRIVTDTGVPPPMDPGGATVTFAPPQGTMLMSSPSVQVEGDWTFEATGLFEPRRIGGTLRSPDWMLKAVRLEGRDVTDMLIEFGPGRSVEGIEVVFTDRIASITGAVADDRGQPVLDATLVLFAGDDALWTWPSRYVRTARPDVSGRYEFRSVPPLRDYRLIAVRDVADDELRDPEFLASVRDVARRLSLGEGEQRVEDVRVRPD